MKKLLLIKFVDTLKCMALMIVLFSCKLKSSDETESQKPYMLSDSVLKIIRIDTVKTHLLEGLLDLNGEITFNENSVVRVMPLIDGVVEDVRVQLGDYVKQGEVIATVKSSYLTDLQSKLSAATAEMNIAKKKYEVTKTLADKGINSEKDVLEAQQNLNKAEAEFANTNKELTIIGGTISGNIAQIKSPVSGYVVSRGVNPNQVIEKGVNDPLFIVSDLKQVWVIANVYESDIEKVKTGEDVSIVTIAYPDKVYSGTIDYLSNVLDPESKTMKIRIVLDNPHNELKPDMFAKVSLRYENNIEVPSISKDAVVFDESKSYVIIYEDRDKLSVRPIELYPANKDVLYIKKGLKAGEKIIGKNQLLIYNELTSF
ncbi:MAG: efflux RND transporter periplasmic adaptor subunit [Bacteroidia bacterium]|nr:efflux RND transporter periplasmic adaptor subunit [Bacteroidia bacterium]